ncbi:hypothetical protein ACO2I3_07215 [Leptospira interrogans]
MKKLHAAAMSCAALLGLALVPSVANAKCVLAGGTATGLTPEISKTLATAALGQSITSYGGKARGKVAMKCDANPLMTTCTAKQRACK